MSIFDDPFDPAREAALVTGAGNGIGRAIAQALVGEGVRTVFADVNRDTVTAAVKASPRPELAVPWVGDLADPAARDALLADAQSARRAGDAFRAQRLAAAARGRSCLGCHHRDMGADACGQSRGRISSLRANWREN